MTPHCKQSYLNLLTRLTGLVLGETVVQNRVEPGILRGTYSLAPVEQPLNHLLVSSFQEEGEAVPKEREAPCTCMPITSMVVMAL